MNMVTIINAHGAVHTISKELFESEYSHCRRLTKAQLAKLGKLADRTSEMANLRLSAVDENGEPDVKARNAAASAMQKAKAAEEAFRKELCGNAFDEDE